MSPGIALRQRLVAETEPVERARPEILGHDIGRADQLAQHLAPGIRLQVNGNPALVAVHHHESGGLAAYYGRRYFAGVVAVRRALNLYHVSAHVGEHEAAYRSCHHVTELDNAHSRERTSVPVCFPVTAVLARHDHRPSQTGLVFFRNAW